MITLHNDFHNTHIRLRAELGQPLTRSQVKRARTALCGIRGCTCGGNLRERGPQRGVEVEPAGHDDAGRLVIKLVRTN